MLLTGAHDAHTRCRASLATRGAARVVLWWWSRVTSGPDAWDAVCRGVTTHASILCGATARELRGPGPGVRARVVSAAYKLKVKPGRGAACRAGVRCGARGPLPLCIMTLRLMRI